MAGTSTERALRHWVDLSLPEYRRNVPPGEVRQAALAPVDAGAWLDAFQARLEGARGHLPVYRMSDGEFVFLHGWLPYRADMLPRYPGLVLRSWAKAVLRRNPSQFLSGSAGYGFESYTPDEWRAAREGYPARVRAVAEEGVLAVNFVSHLHFPRQFVAPTCRWMDAHGIRLDERNYMPFYDVYVLLLGPRAPALYRDRRILIVTSDEDGTKAPGIDRTLRLLGARSTAFVRISRNKSMFDRIDLAGVGPVDLVLIGAGVGALNILEQVRPLGAVAIDAGFVLDCLWRPARFVGQRAFTLPDAGSPLLP